MKIGIKVGLKGDSAQDLRSVHPDFCEVWFHSGKPNAYEELFGVIREVNTEVGLHFWGALEDNTLANLSYPDKKVLEASKQLVKTTIDVAAKHKAWYVNVHPGGAILSKVDFEAEEFTNYGNKVSFETCTRVLGETLTELGSYAKERDVMLLVESVPRMAIGTPWHGPIGRLKPIDLLELPVDYLKPIIQTGVVKFTNDFGHTAANMITKDRTAILHFLRETTQELAPVTQLIHTGYLIPPYNGTDYHGCLYYDEFKSTAALPNYSEMQQLLALFTKRADVGALVEPEKDHPKNYASLKKLVQDIKHNI